MPYSSALSMPMMSARKFCFHEQIKKLKLSPTISTDAKGHPFKENKDRSQGDNHAA